ncbi:hypothetical protein [Yeosuana sp.]|uniref:hypothetical protein n=1 Tax=Yeosuana sp. TaxID=2529388 RepID=UPI0040552AFC|tara:strand:- start:486 stop:899 length:414 start_codon:yes stop_codon:yes gene_type:complete
MKFEDSIYHKDLKHYKLAMPFGDFYLCDKFIVSEINEGIHFNWEMIKSIMAKVIKFYGEGVKLGYISNRVNSYSADPQSWDKLDKEFGVIIASAIVSYNNIVFMNATLEKRFCQKSIKRCLFLDEAVYWISNIKELN